MKNPEQDLSTRNSLSTRLTACLHMSKGTMPVTMVIKSKEELTICEKLLKRRKHCALVDFEVE